MTLENKTVPILFVIGMAGSGKSTIAREVAKAMSAAYLDKDDISGDFVGAALAANGEDPSSRDGSTYYTETLRPLEYETLMKVASANLRAGIPVVLDAPFGAYFSQNDYVREQAEKHAWPKHVRPFIIRVSSNAECTKRRLIERGLERDAWKLARWDEFWKTVGSAKPEWTDVAMLDVANDRDGEANALAASIVRWVDESCQSDA